MTKHRLTITIDVWVESNLDIEELINEFSQESQYEINSTENIEVVHTEWMDCTT